MRPRGIFGTRKQFEAELAELRKQYPGVLFALVDCGVIEAKPYFEIEVDPGAGRVSLPLMMATGWLRTAYKNLGFTIGTGAIGCHAPDWKAPE